MTPEESKAVIDTAGGPSALARKLGFVSTDGKPARQRVGNWRREGIPPAIELEHYELFRRLKREANRA